VKLERTEAIVLHTFASRERDKLVVFLTPDRGKMKGWAYGARAIRSRFGAALEPLAKVRIGYREKESEDVVRIESADLVRSLFPAQQNLVSSVAATYIAETADTFAQEHDPAELLYRLVDRSTGALLEGARPLALVAYVEIWTLRLAGILPSTRECMSCGEPVGRPLRFDALAGAFVCGNCATRDAFVVSNDAATHLETLFRTPAEEFAAIPATDDVLLELRSLAGAIRRNFLGHELKSFDVLAGILGGA
jgi:DNA repair protein RecO (recombination protein O)